MPEFVETPVYKEYLETIFYDHVALRGPAGTGKSSLVKYANKRAQIGLTIINAHADLTIEEARGFMTLKDGSTQFVEGPVLRALKNGNNLLVDEANLCRPGVLAWFNHILDGTPVYVPETQDTVPVPENFRVTFCFNDGYSGTRQINEALLDRCRGIFVDYWDPIFEKAFLQTKVPDLADQDIDEAVTLANAIRGMRRAGEINFDFSLRSLLQMATHADRFSQSLLTSFETVVLGKLAGHQHNQLERQAMLNIAVTILEGDGEEVCYETDEDIIPF